MRPAVVRAIIAVVFMFPGTLATSSAEQPGSEPNQPLPRWTLATADSKFVIGVGTDQRPWGLARFLKAKTEDPLARD